ncbi:GNAT family N-acetyltransferase [Pengzhenrongella sicca]|uniref:GNAT family N-acetyltransferase n=1 Tax=Pengzhenrongella sicca TaxID=2819238 RepID=A0A8A4ZFS5_9MICO|nr:GNAT family N-acetyltransferase [Pengzhenrongella sicca]QTE30860.1 GNAT family N-acetyltransferase [Pengzhenrongella sicca]
MVALEFPTPPLFDAVVHLRPWRIQDVPEKLMAFNDPVIRQFAWSRTEPYSEAHAREYFVEQEQARRTGSALTVAIASPADEAAILGGASLYDVDLNQARAGIGYWLAPDARGRGHPHCAASRRLGLLDVGPAADRADLRAGQRRLAAGG